jgi:4-amino-4-deoxy-L-arabinose transferase-like glycosyltransferase
LFRRILANPYLLSFLIFAGIAARIFLLIVSTSRPEGPLGGGSDAPAYILLGHSILHGNGMAYVGQPTALRAPLYPLMLAALEAIFASHYLLIMRLIQSFLSVLTAWICAKTAGQLWNEEAKWPAFAVAICVPTLLFFATQIITETFAALFVSLFLYFLVQYSVNEEWNALIGMGACCGILLLLRFNTLFLPPLAALAAMRFPLTVGSLKRALLPLVLALVIVSPWLIRNFVVFHGDILYSSQTGTTAFQGALAPEGRGQPEGLIEFQKLQGWWLAMIETDRPSRLNYPSEVELNRQARGAAILAWKGLGFHIVPLLARKTAYFWLSTDQLLDTSSLIGLQRKLRAAGVLVYWGVLAAAILGWLRLRKRAAQIAHLLLLYCVFATVLHLPFTMNTRLRVPLIEPLLCVLAGIALASGSPRSTEQAHAQPG